MTEFVLGKIKFTWQGNWAVSTAYEKDDIVKYGGNTYVCTTGHTSAAIEADFYTDIAKWDVHVEGVTHKGDHATATFYKLNDIVKSGVSQYICTTQHTSTATINLANFTLYVLGGDVATQSGKSGQFLSTDGTNTTWVDIVEAAPGALDTLNELAASLADDPDFAGTITTALAGKEPTLTAGTTTQYYRGDKTWQTLTVDPTMGGDMSGTTSNAQIVPGAVDTAEMANDAVNITKLNVTDGTSGQALMTDGSGTMTFGDVDALPTQTSNAGKFLTTDGTDSSWGALSVSAAAVSDQANTATGYFDVPAGTTAQRPGTPLMGNMRYNSTTGEMEQYSGSGWIGFAGSVPIITSIGPSTAAETGTTITINGANFSGSSTVQLIGTDNSVAVPQTVTFVDVNTLSITTPALTVANEPYDVKVTNPDGQTYTLVNSLDAGGVPAWTTAAGSIGTMLDVVGTPGVTHFTLVAGDPDSTTVTYAETTSVLATAGLSLNSTTGAITGDAPTTQATNSATTYNFDVEASDGVNTTPRSFSVTIMDMPTGGSSTHVYTSTGQGYRSHVFNSSSSFYVAADIMCDILVVAGGGAGGNYSTTNGNGGGGAGAMVVADNQLITSGTHGVTIGGGGSGTGGSTHSTGNTGSDSTFVNTTNLQAKGGGGGGSSGTGNGTNGGCGGGGARNYTGGVSIQDSQGTQNNPGTEIAVWGFKGGSGSSGDWNGSGGGGTGEAGYGYLGSGNDSASSGQAPGGNGGAGRICDLAEGGPGASPPSTTRWFAGGGGGGGNSSEHAGDGYHGGGRGFGTTPQYNNDQWPDEVNSTTLGHSNIHAIINTGAGGGGGSYWASNISSSGNVYGSGSGASGIIIIRYKSG